MTKEKAVFIVGAWIIFLPYLGFPVFWKNLLFVITGLFLMLTAYLMFRHKQVLHTMLHSKSSKDEEDESREASHSQPEKNYDRSYSRPSYTPVQHQSSHAPLVHPVEDVEQVYEAKPRRRISRKRIKEEISITQTPDGDGVINHTITEDDSLR